MMSFKDMVANDIDAVFLNLEEFGEPHKIEGDTITAVLDDNSYAQGGQELGLAESSLTLYAAIKDLPPRRSAGEGLLVDGRELIISSWSEAMGVAIITFDQSMTM